MGLISRVSSRTYRLDSRKMSVNYSEQLSPYPNKGAVGQKEYSETAESLNSKINRLTQIFNQYKGHIVVHTGAGISTSCGIPDFRGPNGVWTLEKKGRSCGAAISFDSAEPSFGHLAVKKLIDLGFVKYLVSQNVDGLHLKSG